MHNGARLISTGPDVSTGSTASSSELWLALPVTTSGLLHKSLQYIIELYILQLEGLDRAYVGAPTRKTFLPAEATRFAVR